MRQAPALTFLTLALALTACGQNQSSGPKSGAAPAPEMTELERQKILASLPPPYNAADLANGRRKFALCSSCHTIAAGAPNLTGPNLHGVVGRAAASVEGYNYSQVLKTSGVSWDAQRLDPWLADPRGYLPGNKMSFVGLKSAKDRTDLIAYLMVEGGQAAR
jgi:cytochrome c